jgi:serine/threonine protein kinase/tetratricopeptide (TPR) repeat protein
MMLGGRYEILQTVGEGGMGAVYKAEDRELGRTVALKVIRPELASNPDILQRFKQEILLASKVTDRNIIRIFDLGDAEGIKFITMEFVEGEDLRDLLHRQGKLPAGEAVDIMEQVISGLRAAHRLGIIHRDLKPGNIMRATDGRVLVMDFGLARSLEGEGMTRTGTMLGTMEYMSPEQAQAKDLDARSDIFTAGLILYELLTGIMPYHAESVIASLLKRTRERAIPVSDIDKKVPGALSNIVSKCLERDPALRYQSDDDLLADLRAWQGKGGSSRVSVSSAGLLMNRIRELSWSRIAPVAVLLVAMVAATAWYFSKKPNATTVAHAPVSVLVADFQNNTSDPLFDDTLEPMFNVALEGASFINAFNRGEARRAAAKLPNPSSKLDDRTATLVATNQGVGVVVSGMLERRGAGYELSLKAVRAVTGETITTTQVGAPNKDQILYAVTKAAVAIRTALGDTTSESDQMFAMETLSATSLEAVHEYSLGIEALTRGKFDEALQSLSKATDLDPNFGAAFGAKAIAANNLGRTQDAVTAIKEAIKHLDRMTERERFRTRGMFYLLTDNYQKCVEEYGTLLNRYPSDLGAHVNLGLCWSNLRNMSKALEETRRATELYPKRVPYQFNVALFQALSGDFAGAEKQAKAMLEVAPNYENGYLILAFADLGQDKLQEAAESYQKLEKISALGASIAAAGIADLASYEGRFAEAARILQQAATTDQKAKRLNRTADKFAALANTELLRNRYKEAQAAGQEALANDKSVKFRFIAGSVFAQTGATAKAHELAADFASELAAQPQAYGKLIEGEIALRNGNGRDAIKLFTDANNLLNTWLGHFDLGRAYLEAGAFTEADSEFDVCLSRRGEALLLFVNDDVTTYAYFPAVYYYQGRAREGLKTSNFAESYRQYLSIREKAGEDPLLPEIRRRVAASGR